MGKYQYILNYVDDLILCCQNEEDVQETEENLNKKVEENKWESWTSLSEYKMK